MSDSQEILSRSNDKHFNTSNNMQSSHVTVKGWANVQDSQQSRHRIRVRIRIMVTDVPLFDGMYPFYNSTCECLNMNTIHCIFV